MQLAMDETAAVALGILVEEILTSSLLPLARQHVVVCRGCKGPLSLSSMSTTTTETATTTTTAAGDTKSTATFLRTDFENVGSKHFSNWTLPVHEAIVNISAAVVENTSMLARAMDSQNKQDSPYRSLLPSSQPPFAISYQSWHSKYMPTILELLSSKTNWIEIQKQQKRLEYRNIWCQRNNYTLGFLKRNQHLFRLFAWDDTLVDCNHVNEDEEEGKDDFMMELASHNNDLYHHENHDKQKNIEDKKKFHETHPTILEKIQKDLEKAINGSASFVIGDASEFPIPPIITKANNNT
jgi:hypothetical protein